MLPYWTLPFDRPESLVSGDWVIATYLATGIDEDRALARAGSFAVGQSLGTWVPVPGITPRMVQRYQARVVTCQAVSGPGEPPRWLLRVAFPWDNLGASFAMLLTTLMGNDASTAIRARLLDVELVGKAAAAFAGPRHGVAGLRRVTGVTGRPLLMNIFKPCTGYPPEMGAELFEAAARGGVDLVKDDELLGDTGFNAVADRVKAYLEVARRVHEDCGTRTLYVPNVTDRPARMRDHARAALDAGARGVMVNFVCTGLDALAALSDEFGRDLFLLGHSAAAGVVGNTSDLSIAVPLVVGLLPRLAGADVVLTLYAAGAGGAPPLDLLGTVQAHRLPLGAMPQTMSNLAGGVTPRNVGALFRDFGPDIVIGAGGGVQGHPDGATAGARAMRQAIEAAVAGVDLEQAASGHAELRRALEHWPS